MDKLMTCIHDFSDDAISLDGNGEYVNLAHQTYEENNSNNSFLSYLDHAALDISDSPLFYDELGHFTELQNTPQFSECFIESKLSLDDGGVDFLSDESKQVLLPPTRDKSTMTDIYSNKEAIKRFKPFKVSVSQEQKVEKFPHVSMWVMDCHDGRNNKGSWSSNLHFGSCQITDHCMTRLGKLQNIPVVNNCFGTPVSEKCHVSECDQHSGLHSDLLGTFFHLHENMQEREVIRKKNLVSAVEKTGTDEDEKIQPVESNTVSLNFMAGNTCTNRSNTREEEVESELHVVRYNEDNARSTPVVGNISILANSCSSLAEKKGLEFPMNYENKTSHLPGRTTPDASSIENGFLIENCDIYDYLNLIPCKEQKKSYKISIRNNQGNLTESKISDELQRFNDLPEHSESDVSASFVSNSNGTSYTNKYILKHTTLRKPPCSFSEMIMKDQQFEFVMQEHLLPVTHNSNGNCVSSFGTSATCDIINTCTPGACSLDTKTLNSNSLHCHTDCQMHRAQKSWDHIEKDSNLCESASRTCAVLVPDSADLCLKLNSNFSTEVRRSESIGVSQLLKKDDQCAEIYQSGTTNREILGNLIDNRVKCLENFCCILHDDGLQKKLPTEHRDSTICSERMASPLVSTGISDYIYLSSCPGSQVSISSKVYDFDCPHPNCRFFNYRGAEKAPLLPEVSSQYKMSGQSDLCTLNLSLSQHVAGNTSPLCGIAHNEHKVGKQHTIELGSYVQSENKTMSKMLATVPDKIQSQLIIPKLACGSHNELITPDRSVLSPVLTVSDKCEAKAKTEPTSRSTQSTSSTNYSTQMYEVVQKKTPSVRVGKKDRFVTLPADTMNRLMVRDLLNLSGNSQEQSMKEKTLEYRRNYDRTLQRKKKRLKHSRI